MASNVNAAFSEFLLKTVNLDASQTKTARASREWLVDQIHLLDSSVPDFPFFYSEQDIFFGSFARNTKIRELDDIDIMICLHAQGSVYYEYYNRIEITVPKDVRLHNYCNDGSDILNSRKIINKFISGIESIPQYKKSDISRDQEAAVLNLKSYDWSFDIVPCFFTKEDSQGNTFYLIPDGQGNWKKTDPRKDRDALKIVTRACVLNSIRITKYWNKRKTAPAMQPYLLETMMIYHFANKAYVTNFVDLEIPHIFNYIANTIYNPVYDLKGIQGDLNATLTLYEKIKINERANRDYLIALQARGAEDKGDHKSSIRLWGEIFGPDFPKYG